MSFKKVTLEIDCGGHVSESTFNDFLGVVRHYADDMFDGRVYIKDVEEVHKIRKLDEVSSEEKQKAIRSIQKWMKTNISYDDYYYGYGPNGEPVKIKKGDLKK